MKYRLLDLIVCPSCGGELKVFPFLTKMEESSVAVKVQSPTCEKFCGFKQKSVRTGNNYGEVDGFDCNQCYRVEILDGLLVCECNALFPISGGVPQFLENTLASAREFYEQYCDKIKEINPGCTIDLGAGQVMDRHSKSIHDSFSKEWSLFTYSRDKTWGLDREERKKIFLEETGMEATQLQGKILLDAGCGNGVLTATLSEYQIEVVGMDISQSVFSANVNKETFAGPTCLFVHFVQGNLSNPPFRKEAFDLVYSSGVLHHTPDTKATFSKISPLVKKGGKIFVWVYAKRNIVVRAFMRSGRLIARNTSLQFLLGYCRILAPFYKIITDGASFLGIAEFGRRSIREVTLDLFDAFSPRFNHSHTPEEVSEWLATQGFNEQAISGVKKHGFGVRGVRG